MGIQSNPGKPLLGQEYDKTLDLTFEYKKQQISTDGNTDIRGTEAQDVDPTNSAVSEVKTTDRAQAQSQLNTFKRSYVSTANIEVPETLTAVAVEWQSSLALGGSSENGHTDFAGTSGYLGLDITNSAQLSVSAFPDISPTIIPFYGENLTVMDYYFFLPDGATLSEIISALSSKYGLTVNPWPSFRPVPLYFTLKGEKLSIQDRSTARVSGSYSSGSNSTAESEGVEQLVDYQDSISVKEIRLTIHGAITLTGNPSTPPYTSFTCATSATITGDLSATSSDAASGTISASASPASIPATSGTTAIPTSGLYLYNIRTDSYDYSYTAIRCRIFDFSTY